MTKLILVGLVLAACNREGDHCQVDEMKCDGDTILVCMQAGAKPDTFFSHKSNYYDRTDCPAGTHCIKVGSEVGCADPAMACDALGTKPTVTDTGSAYEVRSCTNHISTNAYLQTASYDKCDLKTFKPRCLDGQSALACVPGELLESEPSVIKEALRGKYVETRNFCAVCGGDPENCNN